MAQKKTAQTFESALERLEEIAARMEANDLPLEELIVVYEEGLGLVRFCSQRLDEAEKRLQVITRNAAGQPEGLAPVHSPDEIPPSTTPQTSATGEDTGSVGDSAARLF